MLILYVHFYIYSSVFFFAYFYRLEIYINGNLYKCTERDRKIEITLIWNAWLNYIAYTAWYVYILTLQHFIKSMIERFPYISILIPVWLYPNGLIAESWLTIIIVKNMNFDCFLWKFCFCNTLINTFGMIFQNANYLELIKISNGTIKRCKI